VFANTGSLASAAWLAERGVAPDQPKWFVEIELHGGSDRGTRLRIDIYCEEWGFQLDHAGRTSWIRVTDTRFVHGRDELDLLPRTTALRDITRLVRWIERELGVQLDRKAPAIRTNIANVHAAVLDWVATL